MIITTASHFVTPEDCNVSTLKVSKLRYFDLICFDHFGRSDLNHSIVSDMLDCKSIFTKIKSEKFSKKNYNAELFCATLADVFNT